VFDDEFDPSSLLVVFGVPDGANDTVDEHGPFEGAGRAGEERVLVAEAGPVGVRQQEVVVFGEEANGRAAAEEV